MIILRQKEFVAKMLKSVWKGYGVKGGAKEIATSNIMASKGVAKEAAEAEFKKNWRQHYRQMINDARNSKILGDVDIKFAPSTHQKFGYDYGKLMREQNTGATNYDFKGVKFNNGDAWKRNKLEPLIDEAIEKTYQKYPNGYRYNYGSGRVKTETPWHENPWAIGGLVGAGTIGGYAYLNNNRD